MYCVTGGSHPQPPWQDEHDFDRSKLLFILEDEANSTPCAAGNLCRSPFIEIRKIPHRCSICKGRVHSACYGETMKLAVSVQHVVMACTQTCVFL